MIKVTGLKTKRKYFIDYEQIDAIQEHEGHTRIYMKKGFSANEVYDVLETSEDLACIIHYMKHGVPEMTNIVVQD